VPVRSVRFRWSPGGMRTRLLAGLTLLLTAGLVTSSVINGYLLDDFADNSDRTTLEVNAGRYNEVLSLGPQTVNGNQMRAMVGAPLGVIGIDQAGTNLFATDRPDTDHDRVIGAAARLSAGQVVEGSGDHADTFLAMRLPSPGLRVVWTDGRPDATPAALILYVDTSLDDATVAALIRRQAVVVSGALVFLVVLAVAVLRIGMRPLAPMAHTAEAIAAGHLRARLPTRDGRSEIDQLALAVNKAFDAQARAEATVRSFAADASHELRTPLATISGWLDLYHQGGVTGPAVDVAFAQIDAEAGRMRLLVEDLALLARLDAGRPLSNDDVDLTQLADGIVNDAQVIYPNRSLLLSAPHPAPVSGDAPRLEQVLRNLVGNAVQHTPDSTAVRVVITADDRSVRLEVIDNGPGIAATNLPRVFERFWRAESSRSRATGGSGLGLAIVEAIVHAHRGEVAVKSVVGAGTTVTVTLPRKAAAVRDGH
jgi:signal transduction histidine kinase